MRTVSELCDLWGTDAELARDIGVPYSTVAAWKQRGSIPAAYWRDMVRAAKARRIAGVTAERLTDLHARQGSASANNGFAEKDAPPFTSPEAGTVERDNGNVPDTGHFSRFKYLRRANFASAEEIADHIRALREEWDRR